MQLGIFAKTFAGTTPLEVLRAARGAGYDAVQYNMACSGLGSLPSSISEEAAEAVHTASAQTGVEIAAVSATYNMIHPDPAAREQGRRSFEAIAAAAHRMGARLLTVCTGSLDPHDQWRRHPDNADAAAWEDLCLEFSRVLAIADRHDVLIGVEPEPANVVSSARRARDIIDAMGSARIRIVLDPANLTESAPPEERAALIDAAVDLLHDRIALAHAKDRRDDGRVVAVGAGVIDFHHVLALLRRSGFRGALVAHGLAAHEATDVAVYLKAALAAADHGP